MSEEKPSYYAIIPANVRYCKAIPDGAKLLYGEITALAQKEGYCWANNEYFSSMYEVEHKTISRWISALEEQDFIIVERFKEQGNTRKIWLNPVIHDVPRYGQKCPESGQKCTTPKDKNVLPPEDKNVPHSITRINTTSNTTSKEREGDSASASPAPDLFVFESIKMKKEDYEKLKKKYSDIDVDKQIEMASNWLQSSGRKLKSHYHFMLNWLNREKDRIKEKQKSQEKDRKFAPCSTGEYLESDAYKDWMARAIK